MNLIPGEPVPPGFEDEVNREAEIQKTIKNYKDNSLIGVEYTVELLNDDEREPSYLCLLCDKRGDPRTIICHWVSYNHRLKYLEKHFPSAIRELAPVRYKPDSRNAMGHLINGICKGIEHHYGRLNVTVYNADDFRSLRERIIEEINEKYHFDEKTGPSFTNAIDREFLKKNTQILQITIKTPARINAEKDALKEPDGLDEISSEEESQKKIPGPPNPKKKRDQAPAYKVLPRVRRSPPFEEITIKTPARINAEKDALKEPDSLDEISSEEESQNKIPGPPNPKKKRDQAPAYKVLPRVRRSPPFEEDRQDVSKKNNNSNNSGSALPSPKELSMQAFQIAQERYKWEKYRCMLEIAVKGLEKSLKEFEKNPEKHPLYPEEWKKFWNRRYKELQTENKIDPNKYDYKPEWIIFWTKRMKELHANEIEEKKKQIKVNLGLKEDEEEKTDQLKKQFKITANAERNPHRPSNEKPPRLAPTGLNPPAPVSGRKEGIHPTKALAVIDISDDEDNERRSSSRSKSKRSRGRSRSRSRSLSPLSDDYRERDRERDSDRRHVSSSYRSLYERSRVPGRPSHSSHYPSVRSSAADYYTSFHGAIFPPPPSYGAGYRVLDPYLYPQYEKQGRFSPPPSKSKGKSKIEDTKEEPEDDGPLTVVAVLRLLTALEEHLGSLGPKVVDLLGKALALEKVKANSADEMLVNEDNSVFFETIKEKLKGLLIADVLDDSQKVRAVKKAVKNIAAIIHQVNEKGKSNDSNEDDNKTNKNKPAEEKPKVKKNTKPTIADLPFDRQIVSTKLAAALVMQGREDVSTADMDKLIYFFILLVKLSKDKVKLDGKPLKMKNILPQLGIVRPISPTLVEEIIEQEVATMVAETNNSEMDVEISEKEANASSSASALESLTDSDLQTLLQNFKHLSTEEQHHLIAHLKKLETADPVRVEKLRKYVNLETDNNKEPSVSTPANSDYKFSDSSRSKRSAGGESPAPPGMKDHYTDDEEANHASNIRQFIDDDDDEEDDDYNFDDVFKAASSNINRNPNERPHHGPLNRSEISPDPLIQQKQKLTNVRQISNEKKPESRPSAPTNNIDKSNSDFTTTGTGGGSIADTQNLIANLMGSLQQSCGKFNNPKQGENSSSDGDKIASVPSARNPQQGPSGASSSSVPFYQQQQQQQQQSQQQQDMYSNFQNMQNPQMNTQDNYFQGGGGGYNNTIAYPNFGYNNPMQAGLNAPQLAPFNSNYMQQQNYNWNLGNGGYK